MPIIQVQMTSGRTPEQKALLQRELTKVAVSILQCPPEVVQVLIDDRYSLRDWSVAGHSWQELSDAEVELRLHPKANDS